MYVYDNLIYMFLKKCFYMSEMNKWDCGAWDFNICACELLQLK